MKTLTAVPLHFSGIKDIVVLTGAGVSVASGLSTYRGQGGVYQTNPEAVGTLNGQMMAEHPEKVWEILSPMRSIVHQAQPNHAHLALARWEQGLPQDVKFTLITQNVDQLHQRAGSRQVVDYHGNLLQTRCSNVKCSLPPFEDHQTYTKQTLPLCSVCGSTLRPDVVLFEEWIPAENERIAKLALRDCELFLAIGTSGSVWPAANFVRSAKYVGARTIFVSLDPLDPPNDAFDEQYLGRAEEILPKLLANVMG
jgi:NAD-dependent deacetylase